MADDANEADLPPGKGGAGESEHAGRPADAPADCLRSVPLFPLPGLVLLPGAVLPLHVFERRFRQMTEHALDQAYDGRRVLGICRVRDGFDPMDDAPPVFDAACLGAIVDTQKLPDGRYNLLVKGISRVRIGEELPVGEELEDGMPVMYRRAHLRAVACTKAFEIDLGEARDKMRALCRRPPILGTPVAQQLEKLFASSMPTAQLADVLAFDLLEDVDDKQALLEETNVRRRVECLAHLLDKQFPEHDSLAKLSKRFDTDD